MAITNVSVRAVQLRESFGVGFSVTLEKDCADCRYIAFSDASSNKQVAGALRDLADWVEQGSGESWKFEDRA